MSTELALIEIKNPLVVFSTPQGLDPVIDAIEKEAKSLHADISTEEGRATIRSLAFKIAKSKTALDKMGKDLTEEQRNQIDAVNAERKRAWERLEAIQHTVRKPLTDWEQAEENRVKEHEAALAHIESLAVFQTGWPTVAELNERAEQFGKIAPRNWQEFDARYNYTVKTVSDTLEKLLAHATKREKEAAELERLRAEEAARKQKEHEERIAAEATKAAEEKAAAEAEAERVRTEKAIQDAKDAAAKAESDRLAAIAKADSDRIAAEEKAKKDAESAAQRERDKIAAEKKAEADALAKREADKEHRRKINGEARAAILKVGAILDADERATAIITAIAKGEIPHVKISY